MGNFQDTFQFALMYLQRILERIFCERIMTENVVEDTYGGVIIVNGRITDSIEMEIFVFFCGKKSLK